MKCLNAKLNLNIFLLLFAITRSAVAQTDKINHCINLSDLRWSDNVTNKTGYFVDRERNFDINSLSIKAFNYDLTKYKGDGKIPGKWISSDIFMKLTFFNPYDTTVRLYFSPGYFFTKFDVYQSTRGNAPGIVNYATDDFAKDHGYTLLKMSATDTTIFYFRLRLLKTGVNHINCYLTETSLLRQKVLYAISSQRNINLVTYIICGFMLMMFFYSLANLAQTLKKEFLFYAGYTTTIFLLLYLKSALFRSTTSFNFFFEGYFDFFIQLISFYLYLAFLKKFLSTKEKYRLLDKALSFSQKFLILVFIVYTVIFFSTDNLLMIGLPENGSKFYMLILGIFFIIYGLRFKDMLVRYMVMGNIALVGFGMISLLLIITRQSLFPLPQGNLFNNALFYYDIGLFLESVFFLMGLSYKNKKDIEEKTRIEETLKLENERKEMEKQLAIIQAQHNERNRISADMHDELGAGMTAIRLTSELAMRKYEEQHIPELEKISTSSNDLLNNMNAIIWSMNTSNDKLENLASYIRSYALEYFDNSNIKCTVIIPGQIPDLEVNGEKRRNIFLSIKEALNNILKHSGASEVIIEFIFNEKICIEVKDNGKGVDIDHVGRFGNGLKNMERRMDRIEGTFRLESNHGTILNFCIPY